MTKDNHLLGSFALTGIAPAPRGQPQLEVTFDIDVNGILTVRAEDKDSGNEQEVVITSDKGRLSPEEIERMLKEAEEMAEEDRIVKERVVARHTLEGLAYSVKTQATDTFAEQLSEDEKSTLENAAQEALDWLEENTQAEKEEIEAKQQELNDIVQPIVSQYMAGAGAAGDEEMPDHDDL